MEDNDVFNKNLDKLKELFPNQINEQEESRLRKSFLNIEEVWNNNLSERIKRNKIKYLLICEAPPLSGDYFYKNKSNKLFKQVWKTFFGNQKICQKSNDAYQCLADEGFLLIDVLPYSMLYSLHRHNPQFFLLINGCLPWWLNKLNGIVDKNTKIAFGYNQAALNVMISLKLFKRNNPLKLFKKLTPELIAQNRAGQPTSKRLKVIFSVQNSKFKC